MPLTPDFFLFFSFSETKSRRRRVCAPALCCRSSRTPHTPETQKNKRNPPREKATTVWGGACTGGVLLRKVGNDHGAPDLFPNPKLFTKKKREVQALARRFGDCCAKEFLLSSLTIRAGPGHAS
nr:hypothetical protein [Pandoravirus massiliensis]